MPLKVIIFGGAALWVALFLGWTFGFPAYFGVTPRMILWPSSLDDENPGPAEITVRHPATDATTVAAYPRTTPPPPLPCSLPRPAPEDKLVVFGTNQGDGIASVSTVGVDQVTTAGRVVIEIGKDPIYLVLSTYEPIVWTFEGATERLSRVVLATQLPAPQKRSAAGLTGVPADKVTFVRPGDCFTYFTSTEGYYGDVAAETLKRLLGRVPDTFATSYDVFGVKIPSATTIGAPPGSSNLPPGYDRDEWWIWLRSSAGVFKSNVQAVVAQAPVVAYEVLPQEAGLSALVGNGSLVRTDRTTFKIVKPIPRYPAGLTSDHAVHFLLAADVPTPKGDPGDSCVTSDSGRVISKGAACGRN